jgi:hypothetical protein
MATCRGTGNKIYVKTSEELIHVRCKGNALFLRPWSIYAYKSMKPRLDSNGSIMGVVC